MLQRTFNFIHNSMTSKRARFVDAATFIARYRFPLAALAKASEQLTRAQLDAAQHGLKNYFLAHAHQRARRNFGHEALAMPSAGTDALWHAFILCMRDYETFCKRAFGEMLYHTPARPGAAQRMSPLMQCAQTYTHVSRARSDAYAYVSAPHFTALGAISALFVDSAFATPDFPVLYTFEEIASESARQVTRATQSRGADGCSSSSAGVCFGGCEPSTLSNGCAFASAGGDDRGGSGGWGSGGGDGDGGGGCGGGGCGS